MKRVILLRCIKKTVEKNKSLSRAEDGIQTLKCENKILEAIKCK
jgi:hypothetical protein